MVNFDASKEWVILTQIDVPGLNRAVSDLARYIGLLAAPQGSRGQKARKQPELMNAAESAPPITIPVITLQNEGGGPEMNGFC